MSTGNTETKPKRNSPKKGNTTHRCKNVTIAIIRRASTDKPAFNLSFHQLHLFFAFHIFVFVLIESFLLPQLATGYFVFRSMCVFFSSFFSLSFSLCHSFLFSFYTLRKHDPPFFFSVFCLLCLFLLFFFPPIMYQILLLLFLFLPVKHKLWRANLGPEMKTKWTRLGQRSVSCLLFPFKCAEWWR